MTVLATDTTPIVGTILLILVGFSAAIRNRRRGK